jgi:hypothetical protein
MYSGFDFRGLRCAPLAGDESSWQYLPLSPDLRRDADGVPQLTVVEAGETAHVLVTATWAAPEADLEALRDELAARLGQPSPARIQLAFVPVTEPRCALLAGDGSGSFETVATSATSGIAPYDAVFSLALRGDRLAAADARHGEPGLLALEYTARLPVTVTGSATLTARADRLAARLSSRPAASDLVPLLDEAVRDGLAVVTLDVPDQYLGALTTTLYDRVLAEAARALPNWLDDQRDGDLRISVSLEHLVYEPVRAFADIGSVVAGASTRAAAGGPHAAD